MKQCRTWFNLPVATILFWVFVGGAISLSIAFFIQSFPPQNINSVPSCSNYTSKFGWFLCRLNILMEKHSPWILFTGIASVPSLIVLWNWKEKKRRDDTNYQRIQSSTAIRRLHTERFTQAIEQLGSESKETQLGSIYALEKLALDAPEDYLEITLDTICAYINSYGSKGAFRDENLVACLRVIGHLSKNSKKHIYINQLNLKNRIFSERLIFSGVDFENISLMNITTNGTQNIDKGCEFIKCRFSKSVIESCDFSMTAFGNCQFSDCNIHDSNLSLIQMTEVYFDGCSLNSSSFSGARLHNVQMLEVSLLGTDFENVILSGDMFSPDEFEFGYSEYDKTTIFPHDFYPEDNNYLVDVTETDEDELELDPPF